MNYQNNPSFRLLTVTLGCALGASGCIFSGLADDDGAADTDGDVSSMFVECRDDASDPEVTDTIAIVDAYDESLHEMVACGGLNVVLCTSVISGVIEAIIEQSNDATPDDWEFRGEGVYYTNGGMADMETRFYLSEDFEFGNAGDLVTQNLFLVESYLVNARLDITDALSGSAELHFDGPGPLVELLGFGPNPQSPLQVSINDLTTINQKLKALTFESDVRVTDPRDSGTITYHLTTDRMPASSLIDGMGMGYNLEMADGSRAELAQTLTVDSWDVDFVNEGGGALTGTIDFHVDGDHFDFKGVMVYDNSTYADPQLSCP
jgi:hypothetical protein